jgi:uncharacterized protein
MTDTLKIHHKAIAETRQYVESALAEDGSGHDWWHIHRVWRTAQKLAQLEGADALVVELSALLHDIGDWKFHNGDETVGPRMAREWLQRFDLPAGTIDSVSAIIAGISFKGAKVATPMPTIEGQVVQDADRLDAIGAVGIARAFAYGGHAGRLIHHPHQPPQPHASFAEYKKSQGHTINHFYEKLLLLKDRMHTPAGKRMAEERHRFMELYLQQFFREWNGDA